MSSESGERDGGQGIFLPLLLLAVAVVGWSSFQSVQLVIERNNLREAIGSQDTQVEQSRKLRTALESLGNGIAKLARSGNANATLVVEELRKRGITVEDERQAPAGDNQP
jgi:hypothetical protein